MNFDLSTFDARQLDSLVLAADKRKSQLAKRRPIAVVRAELTATAAEFGYAIDELFGVSAPQLKDAKSKARHPKGKVAVKYRDPENRKNTWSGRGSQPRWLREKVRRGLSPSDFLVDGLARPTANTKSIGKRTVFKQA